MRRTCVIAAALLCAGCTSGGSTARSGANEQTAAAVPDCRQFNTPTTIDGQQQLLSGLACRQPDGTWKPVDRIPPYYASPAYAYNSPVYGPPGYAATAFPDSDFAANCAYPIAAQYTEQCNGYINRHKFGKDSGTRR